MCLKALRGENQAKNLRHIRLTGEMASKGQEVLKDFCCYQVLLYIYYFCLSENLSALVDALWFFCRKTDTFKYPMN